MSFRALGFSVLLALALGLGGGVGACEGNGNPEVTRNSGGSGGSAGSGGTEAGGATGGQDGGQEDGGDGSPSDAPLAPVRVGIIPTPPSLDGGVGGADQKLALFESLAVGSRGVSIVRRWKDVFSAPTTPSAAAWLELGDASSVLHDSGASMLFCLAIVDRTLDARPAGSPAGWNDASTRAALDAAIDQVFSKLGDSLAALSFGNELDRFLAKADVNDRKDLLALLAHGLGYAKSHPARPPTSVVGVTFDSDALASADADLLDLVAASDVAIVTYYPVDTSFQARDPGTVGADLDELRAALVIDGGDAGAVKPIFVQEVGYPSAGESSSSPDQQGAFYQGLFQALGPRRGQFPFLSVNGLHDPPAAVCQAEAIALGAPANAAAIASRCSLGLRMSDGTAKPAYSALLAGLAAFSKP